MHQELVFAGESITRTGYRYVLIFGGSERRERDRANLNAGAKLVDDDGDGAITVFERG